MQRVLLVMLVVLAGSHLALTQNTTTTSIAATPSTTMGATTTALITTSTSAPTTAAPAESSASGSTEGESGSNSGTTAAPNTTAAPPRNTSVPPPPLPDPVPSASITAMQSTAAIVSLLAAPLNPSLCPHAARTSLIIDQSRCNYNAQLDQIEVVFYPVQIGFADSATGKYFAAALILWPFALVFFMVHYVLVLKAAGGGESTDEKLILHELAQQRFNFPSLSAACLGLFFWQPLVSSGMTVLVHGVSTWPKIIALVAVIFTMILASFVGRYFVMRRALIECVPVDVMYQRRHAFNDFLLHGGDVKRMLGIVIADGTSDDTKGDASKTDDGGQPPPDGGAEMQPPRPLAAAAAAAAAAQSDEQPKKALTSKSKARLRALLQRDWCGAEASADVAAASPKKKKRPAGSKAWRSFLSPRFEQVFLSQTHWCDAAGRFGFARKNGFMFKHYANGRQWFMIVEIVFCTIFGALDGVKPQTVDGCWVLATSNFSFLSLYVLLLIALRPYLTLWDNITFVLLTSQQAVSCGLLLGAGNHYTEDIRVTGATYGFACLSVVTLKGLLDFGVKLYLKSVKDKAWAVKVGELSDNDDDGDDDGDDDDDGSDDSDDERQKKKKKKGGAKSRGDDSESSEDDRRKAEKKTKQERTPSADAARGGEPILTQPLLIVPVNDSTNKAAASPASRRPAAATAAVVTNPLLGRGRVKVAPEDANIDVDF